MKIVEKTEFKLDEITAYRISFELSNYLREIVSRWESFERRNVGAPFLNSVDSISTHIARGFGGLPERTKLINTGSVTSICTRQSIGTRKLKFEIL